MYLYSQPYFRKHITLTFFAVCGSVCVLGGGGGGGEGGGAFCKSPPMSGSMLALCNGV